MGEALFAPYAPLDPSVLMRAYLKIFFFSHRILITLFFDKGCDLRLNKKGRSVIKYHAPGIEPVFEETDYSTTPQTSLHLNYRSKTYLILKTFKY